MVPTECQMKGANSEKCSLYLESSSKALSRFSAYLSSSMCLMMSCFSCSEISEFIIKDPWEISLKLERGISKNDLKINDKRSQSLITNYMKKGVLTSLKEDHWFDLLLALSRYLRIDSLWRHLRLQIRP